MRYYSVNVVGIGYEGRAEYIEKYVEEADELHLVPEPDNPHDPNAVAVYHKRTKIGYIPANKSWVLQSIKEGDELAVIAEEMVLDDEDEPVAFEITIFIVKDGNEYGKQRKAPRKATKAAPKSTKVAQQSTNVQQAPVRTIGLGSLILLLVAAAVAGALLMKFYAGKG